MLFTHRNLTLPAIAFILAPLGIPTAAPAAISTVPQSQEQVQQELVELINEESQHFTADAAVATISRDHFTATSPEEVAAIQAAKKAEQEKLKQLEQQKITEEQAKKNVQPVLTTVIPDPGSAQAEAHTQVLAQGWGEDQFSCLVSLWNKESGWNHTANNPSSGAYGIPQSLPGSKMGSAGADWQTNPATQIRWGIGYIQGRYGTPCSAWNHSGQHGWY